LCCGFASGHIDARLSRSLLDPTVDGDAMDRPFCTRGKLSQILFPTLAILALDRHADKRRPPRNGRALAGFDDLSANR
jgi:hypothetical protein